MLRNPALRYISHADGSYNPNPFYVTMETHLHELFVQGENASGDEVNQLYVAKRVTYYSPESRSALISRMPADVKQLADQPTKQIPSIDVAELDFIDFLLHYRHNRVLFIIGSIGIGKTTFIRHVLFHARMCCPSLRRFMPIVLDCLRVCQNQLDYGDLIYEVGSALKETSTAFGNGMFDQKAFDALANRFDFTDARSPSVPRASSFLAFMKGIKELCRSGIEPVLVFDNVDQCPPTTVAGICTLGRGVFLDCGIFVVIAMRPPTYRTQVERLHDKGAFYRFAITLTPPDLPSIIEQRLKHAVERFMTSKLTSEKGARLLLSDPEQSLKTLAHRLLSPIVQSEFLTGVCNNDIRRALASFVYFLKFRDLDYQLLLPSVEGRQLRSDESRRLEPKRGWFRHLLDGLMIGPHRFYRSEKSPIFNIFHFDEDGYGTNYVILYRCLTLLGWAGQLIETSKIFEWLESFGYEHALSKMVCSRLLRARMIYSPEDEYAIECTEHVRLSASGEYYVGQLVQNPQYLYNVIYDVRLAHALWVDQDSDSFRTRINSIHELIQAVVQTERRELRRLMRGQPAIPALGSLRQYGFLTRRLITAASLLADDAYHTRYKSALDAARDFELEIAPLKTELEDAEGRLGELLAKQGLLSHDAISASPPPAEYRIGDDRRVRVRAPRQLSPALQNLVDIEVDLSGFESAEPLVLFWRGTSQSGEFSELVQLKRHPNRPTYSGSFTVPNVRSVQPFPQAQIALLRGSEPILIDQLCPRT